MVLSRTGGGLLVSALNSKEETVKEDNKKFENVDIFLLLQG